MHINITSGATNFNVVVALSHSNIVCPGIIITPAQVNVSGRTVDPSGAAIARVSVSITSTTGDVIATTSSGFDGSYTLTGITVGQTYIVQATNKSYTFTPRTLSLLDETTGFDLVGTRHF
jgi:hypothetical protein